MRRIFAFVIFFLFCFLGFSFLKTYSVLQTFRKETVRLRRQLDSLAMHVVHSDFLACNLPIDRWLKHETRFQFNEQRWAVLVVFLQDNECFACFKDHLHQAQEIRQEAYPILNDLCFDNAFSEREISFFLKQEQTILPFYSARSFPELYSIMLAQPHNCTCLVVLLNSSGKILHYQVFKDGQNSSILRLVRKYKQLSKGD